MNSSLVQGLSPKVTVAIPAYKSTFLEKALKSVLAQEFEDYEIVVCQDGNDESVHEVLKPFLESLGSQKIRYYKNDKRLYGGGTLGRCIELARGDYIKPVFDDDVLLPDCIDRLVRVLDQYPHVSLASSKRDLIDENDELLPDQLFSFFPFEEDTCLHGKDLVSFFGDTTLNFIGEPSSVLFRRRQVLSEIHSLFHLDGQPISWVGDLALYVKLLRQGNLALLKESLSSFRFSVEQFSNRGRVTPGVGDKGHADFKQKIRTLGWLRPNDNHLVRVKPLHGAATGFEPLSLMDFMTSRFRARTAKEHIADWGVENWLQDRAPSAARALALDTLLQANPQAGTLGVLVLFDGKDPVSLEKTLKSLQTQLRRLSSVWVIAHDAAPGTSVCQGIDEWVSNGADWPAAVNARLARTDAPDFLWILNAGDVLLPHSALLFGEHRLCNPTASAWYVDEVVQDSDGTLDPLLKPDFNLDFLRSYPYVGRALIFRSEALREIGGLNSRFLHFAPIDGLWRLIEAHGFAAVGHIPEVLIQSKNALMDWLDDRQTSQEFEDVTRSHLGRMGIQAELTPLSLCGGQKIRYQVGSTPLISLIIPSKNQFLVLRQCIEHLMARTSYPNYELLIVDNGSTDADACQFLNDLNDMGIDQVRVLRWPKPFSFSALGNYAVQHARGDVLAFLDNDLVFSNAAPDWLSIMLGNALRPEVGIVGGRLDYPRGEVEHAGIILGFGDSVGHAFQDYAVEKRGYMRRLVMQQNVSAVSGSLMMMRREVFEELGGFDEQDFPVYFGDVDLALKAGQAGFLQVMVPDTGIAHMGGASRLLFPDVPRSPDEELKARFRSRWRSALGRDRAYHPAFSKYGPSFALCPDGSRLKEPLPGRPLPVVMASHSDWHGCGHYRVIHPFHALESQLSLEGGLTSGIFHFADVARIQPSAIVIQGAWGSELALDCIARYREVSDARIVLEFDDFLPNVPTRHEHRRLFSRNPIAKMRRVIEQADWLVVSTPVLAEEYSAYHRDIRIAQNGLLPDWWSGLQSQRRAGKKMRVGWAGGSSHAGDLAQIRALVKDMENEVEWVFMGMKPDGVRCEYHEAVPIAQYPQKLASLNLDLAVVPLEMNQFNRSKSNLRLLELGACGVPVICTDIDPYRGELPVLRVDNRYQDWAQAIRSMVSEPEALARAGDELRESILRDWMLQDDFLSQWRNAWLPA